MSEKKKAEPKPERKAYIAPELVEYGSITKLTQGATGTVGDALGMNMAPCL
jgi:hypothetical protein